MKAHIFKSEVSVNKAGENVLTGVILHPSPSLLPVERTMILKARFKR